MPKAKLAGLLVFGIGAVLGISLGGQIGLGFLALALVIGFGLWFSAEARGTTGASVRDEWNPEIVRPRQEQITELNTERPLECGVPRQGWLHFRFEGVSPSALKNGELRLSIQDLFSNTHSGLATGPVRHFTTGRKSIHVVLVEMRNK
jgi:hypothetical protein